MFSYTEHMSGNFVTGRIACPGCKSAVDSIFFTLRDIPVNCTTLWHSPVKAQSCQKGELGLSLCNSCGLVFNRYFDSSRLDYDEAYENSLDHSPAFQKYLQELTARLRARYKLRSKRIIEIGSGRGEFLKLLGINDENHCIGYDPSFKCDNDGDISPTVRFVQDYYSERYASEPVDFLACRHVLEHIPEPLVFLSNLRRTLAAQGEVHTYFEVPNGFQVFGGLGMWDVLYPHVHYFTLESLSTLFQRAGFELIETGFAFAEQFLYLEARAGTTSHETDRERLSSKFKLSRIPTDFEERFSSTVEMWSSFLCDNLAAGKHIAFWGAGAKGITFLNVVPHARQINYVIDINPRKQGTYVPGTGQCISAPSELKKQSPDVVITLNPVYEKEINSMIDDLGVEAKVVSNPEPVLKG
jgi:SAM-dependent methyltransferase